MLFLAWLACSEPLCGEVGSATAATGRDGGGNVLVVLVDDVGVEAVERWGVGPVPAATPVLDCLCDRGLRLTQTWASPVCSPTRAEVQTGRYSRRHRLGDILRPGASGYALDVGEDSLADLAAREGYATGLFGKWHLVDSALPDAVTHPNRSGWDRFAGTLHNLGQDAAAQGNGGSYFDGPWIVDGEVGELDRYATTRTVDDALAFVDEVRGQPWLVMLAFHGPHIPYHDPPDELVVERRPGQDPETTQFLAALQAVDRELGRFLRGLTAPPRATRSRSPSPTPPSFGWRTTAPCRSTCPPRWGPSGARRPSRRAGCGSLRCWRASRWRSGALGGAARTLWPTWSTSTRPCRR